MKFSSPFQQYAMNENETMNIGQGLKRWNTNRNRNRWGMLECTLFKSLLIPILRGDTVTWLAALTLMQFINGVAVHREFIELGKIVPLIKINTNQVCYAISFWSWKAFGTKTLPRLFQNKSIPNFQWSKLLFKGAYPDNKINQK